MNKLDGTNIIMIKTKEGKTFLLKKVRSGTDEILIIKYPFLNVDAFYMSDGKMMAAELSDKNCICKCSKVNIEDNKVLLTVAALTNVDIVYSKSEEEIPDIRVRKIGREEDTLRLDGIMPIENVQNIYADPTLIEELLNRGVIEVDDRLLKEYDISPKFIVYDCKNKTKKYVYKHF